MNRDPRLPWSTRSHNLAHFLTRNAARLGDRPAIIWQDLTITWAELDRRVSALATAFVQDYGLQPGDRIIQVSQSDVTDPEDVARKVAAVHAGGEMTDAERRLAEDIFRLMLRDAEVRVRAALSEALKDNPGVPHDVAHALARDVVPVATPILEFSEALTDDDLMEIVRAQPGAAQQAVARRREISAELSQTIVAHGVEAAAETVVTTPGADLP
mgnify:CR=1 FL=1